MTYHVEGARSFKIEETHLADVSNRLHVYASSKGSSWSLVPLKYDVAASASGNWYTQFFHPAGYLPDGTNYVRVELRGDPNIWTQQLDRIKILTSNLAFGRPAYASSVEPGTSLVASNAVDGNTGTRWSSARSDPQWFYVDLGSAQQVSRVVLLWEAAYARKFQIQVSTLRTGNSMTQRWNAPRWPSTIPTTSTSCCTPSVIAWDLHPATLHTTRSRSSWSPIWRRLPPCRGIHLIRPRSREIPMTTTSSTSSRWPWQRRLPH